MTHPAIEAWFATRGWTAFAFQREVWSAYAAGESGLIHAATGTGKTYAAWLAAVGEWLATHDRAPTPLRSRRGARDASPPLTVLWLTPLKALAGDTAEALRAPLEPLGVPWSVETRTGDTSSHRRARQRERLPTALITTPESLSLLLTLGDAATRFADLRLVVADEWHELLGSKRGVQTQLALARLRAVAPQLRVWGLSATLGNLDVARAALLGVELRGGVAVPRPGRIVRGVVPKPIVIESVLPPEIERFPWAGHLGLKLLPQVLEELEQARTALVFTNTRSFAEQWYQAILAARPQWAGTIGLHHGSLDRARREWVEGALRDGRLRCVVCTSSLDLGVDFQPVERVLQIGSPKGVARLLQRAGRSGHRPGETSRVRCVPTHALELVEVAAVRAAAADGALEGREPPERPLDVLVQHLVTVAAGDGFEAEALWREVRTTWAYRDLARADFDWALAFVTRGGVTLAAYPEYHRVVEREGRWVAASPAVARRHRLAIGTIVGDASVGVRYLTGGRLGTVEEQFAARLRPGDRFHFAGRTLAFVRLRDMTVWVRRAADGDPVVPRWMGSRMPLSSELSHALRQRLDRAAAGEYEGPEMTALRPLLELQTRWSRLPREGELLIERLQTRDGHHLFVYPFEGRLVHEGLAAVLAYRLSRHAPRTYSMAANDYGLELLSREPAPLEIALADGLLSPERLGHDVRHSLNAAELARRQFREIARVSGLLPTGWPGQPAGARQLQASSGLLFDVFTEHDPANLLLRQADEEVLDRQLEATRLARTLRWMSTARLAIATPQRPTPLAFPLLVDRTRNRVSSETLADRVRRMQLALERAAG